VTRDAGLLRCDCQFKREISRAAQIDRGNQIVEAFFGSAD